MQYSRVSVRISRFPPAIAGVAIQIPSPFRSRFMRINL